MRALTAAEQALVERARHFTATVVLPNAQRWEEERRVPVEALGAACALGLAGIQVPTALGGAGGGFLAKLAIAELMSEADMAFAFSLINTHNVAQHLAEDGQPALAAEWVPQLLSGRVIGASALTEPGAGSDFAAIRTRAERVSGGWRLTGEKAWITNAAVADVFRVYAQSDPAARGRGIGCFLVDARRPGFTRLAPFRLMGAHAIGAGSFRLDGYFCPDGEVLAEPGTAFRSALTGLNGARAYVAAMCCGMLRAGLMHAVQYGAGRHAFGRPLIRHQGLAWMLADAATDLEAARALALKAAALVDAGAEAQLPAAHAKKFAARAATHHLGELIQAMGATGLRADLPLGRHLACARAAAFTDGSSEIQNERIAAALAETWGPAAPPLWAAAPDAEP